MKACIASLPTDLLYLLFSLNVEIPDVYRSYGIEPAISLNGHSRRPLAPREEHPLNELRRYSQVCRRWRHLALDSPTLWAGLIDLDHMEYGKEEWRAEVLRRTKQAPLSVIGRVHARTFLDLVKKEWTRVRHVDVALLNGLPLSYQWEVFGTPAPTLRTLRLSGALLRVLSIPAYPSFDPRATWVIQLRRLDLQDSTFTLEPLLEVLPQMTQLEHLYIERKYQRTSMDLLRGEIAPIILPRLVTFVLSDGLLSVFAILAHILPNPTALVNIDAYTRHAIQLSPADLHALSRIFGLHLQTHTFAESSFTVEPCNDGLSVTSVSPSLPSIPHFRFRLLCTDMEMEADTLMPLFLDSAFRTNLSGVREVEFVCYQNDEARRRAVVHCDNALILSLLPQVSVLRLSMASLVMLHSHSPIPLPIQSVEKLAVHSTGYLNQALALATALRAFLRPSTRGKQVLGSLKQIEFDGDLYRWFRDHEGYGELEDALALVEEEGVEVLWKGISERVPASIRPV